MSIRVPLKHSLYLDLGILLVTGLLYAVPAYLDRWFFYELDWPFSNYALISLHGGAAIFFLYLFGYLTRCHVQVHLRSGRHLSSGLTMLGILSILAVTGFALYYLGSETLRLWSADIHCLLGVILPTALLGHRFHGALATPRKQLSAGNANTEGG